MTNYALICTGIRARLIGSAILALLFTAFLSIGFMYSGANAGTWIENGTITPRSSPGIGPPYEWKWAKFARVGVTTIHVQRVPAIDEVARDSKPWPWRRWAQLELAEALECERLEMRAVGLPLRSSAATFGWGCGEPFGWTRMSGYNIDWVGDMKRFVPTGISVLALTVNIAFWFTIIFLLYTFAVVAVRTRRLRRGLCWQCSYPCSSESGRCPECGAEYKLPEK